MRSDNHINDPLPLGTDANEHYLSEIADKACYFQLALPHGHHHVRHQHAWSPWRLGAMHKRGDLSESARI